MKKVVINFTDGENLNVSGEIKKVRINPIINCLVIRFWDGSKNVFPLENIQRIALC